MACELVNLPTCVTLWRLVLISRPEWLEIVEVEFDFNFQTFEYLEIDLLYM